jgi:hypothetical protein
MAEQNSGAQTVVFGLVILGGIVALRWVMSGEGAGIWGG